MKELNQKCPNCGAFLEYTTRTRIITCEYCKSKFTNDFYCEIDDFTYEKLNTDPMLHKAIIYVIEVGKASTPNLQRNLRLNYVRAKRFMSEMEHMGIIDSYKGSYEPQEVLVTYQQYIDLLHKRNISDTEIEFLNKYMAW